MIDLTQKRLRAAAPKYAAGALVLLTVWLLNPWREMPLEDDWAYAWTVEHLMRTGKYELHPWLSANMPFQAVWGAAFSWILGGGFAALRISTLFLSGVGLWAFYRLLRDAGRNQAEAAVGVILLWSSPLYLRFSFNFMTDVPFTALVLLSVWLYARAWTRMSYGWMAAAAMTGTAAVLTRQFGVALIPALIWAAWLRRPAAQVGRLAAIAVVPLLAAAAYQGIMGIAHPTWAQRINLQGQAALSGNWRLQLEALLWRPGVMVQYLCLFTLPLAVWLIPRSWQWRRSRHFVRACYGVAAVLGISLAVSWAAHRGVTLPSIPWNLEELADTSQSWRRVLTLAILIGSVPYLARGVTALPRDLGEGDVLAVLFHGTMLCLLPMTLAYQQFGDEYLIVYVPWVIWTAGRAAPLRSRWAVMAMCGLGVVQLGIVTTWVDGILTRNQVQWQAAQQVVERLRVPPASVSANWTWAAYHEFDDYMARYPAEGQTDFRSLFDRWLPDYRRRAAFQVSVRETAGAALPGDVATVRRRTVSGAVWEARAERIGFEFLEKSAAVRDVAAGGRVRKAVAAGEAGGAVEYAVTVPAANAMLSFAAAIPDAATGARRRLVTFEVLLNGAVMWRQEILPGAWRAGSIELAPYAGSTVRVRFASNGPGAWSAMAISLTGN